MAGERLLHSRGIHAPIGAGDRDVSSSQGEQRREDEDPHQRSHTRSDGQQPGQAAHEQSAIGATPLRESIGQAGRDHAIAPIRTRRRRGAATEDIQRAPAPPFGCGPSDKLAPPAR